MIHVLGTTPTESPKSISSTPLLILMIPVIVLFSFRVPYGVRYTPYSNMYVVASPSTEY